MLLKPWITHWALALVKGNREPHEAKKKSFDLGGNRTHDLRIRSTVTLPTELQGRTEKVGDDLDGESWRRESKSGGRGFDSHRGQKIFSLPRVVPCFPLLGLTPSGLFMGLSSTIIYTSELILCSTICVPSATRHNIHMYPYFLFAAIHHLKSSPTFSVRPCSSVGRVTEDLIRRSWVWFPLRSKDFFFALSGSLFPFTRANAQWVIHGFK